MSVVKKILQSSRQRNTSLGLSGALVFDGERFCELLEGHVYDISAVYRDVEFDPNHVELRVLHMSLTTAPRRLTDWRCGYCDGPELDVFVGDDGLQGEAAVTAFVQLLERCDFAP